MGCILQNGPSQSVHYPKDVTESKDVTSRKPLITRNILFPYKRRTSKPAGQSSSGHLDVTRMIRELKWDGEIVVDRIYLPAGCKKDERDQDGLPIDEEIANYVNREFPLPSESADDTSCFPIPRTFIEHGKQQASRAEMISYQKLSQVRIPKSKDDPAPLWQVFFQGVCYAGRSYRNTRDGKFMTREHDLVVFNIYKGKYYVSLIEVKSTCDDPSTGYVVGDSISIKNNKRSGQHQLRDHVEILKNVVRVPENSLNCFLFWPFLTKWTIDPRGNRVKRWEQEENLHLFTDTLSDQDLFNDWFYNIVLCGRSIEKVHFDALFKRFIILSCGIFVNEIHEGMLALLSQQQVSLMYKKPSEDGQATVVHGAAGTGKTLLVLHKLIYLHERGMLNHKNRALYICYWLGIRNEFKQKLEKLGIAELVDTEILYITRDGFLKNKKTKYRHIFMDECEAICLSFSEEIIVSTFKEIERCRLTDYDEDFLYRQNNFYDNEENDKIGIPNTSECPSRVYGDLWYLVDVNQTTLFAPKYGPILLKEANVTLTRVVRNTGNIYKFYTYTLQLDKDKMSVFYQSNIDIGHNIVGPPIYWVNSDNFSKDPICPNVISNATFNGLVRVITDLYSSKGIKARDLCVLPFLVSEIYRPDNLNKAISSFFNGFQPMATTDIIDYVCTTDENKFLATWVLKVKGLEFKVVVIVIDAEDDFNIFDIDDRRKVYIMASRCTCLLILVSTESVKDIIDVYKVIKAYPFDAQF